MDSDDEKDAEAIDEASAASSDIELAEVAAFFLLTAPHGSAGPKGPMGPMGLVGPGGKCWKY